MEIVCLGLSHRTADVGTREQFAVPESGLRDAVRLLASTAPISEAVIVSTCNRVEFYGAADNRDGAMQLLREKMRSRSANLAAQDVFYEFSSPESIRHLFRVVSGLESMVLGETEILGQVKKAYQCALEAGSTARNLNKLFQRAFNVAKEVRSHTNITRGPVSVGAAAVELAERIFGKLSTCKVMVLGVGETGEQTARALLSRGAHSIFVANRNFERAMEVAAALRGAALRFEEWENWSEEIDIMIGSTSAPHPVITRRQIEKVMANRPERPLFLIDLAVPRDVEPEVNQVEGVYLYDIDSLQAIADQSLVARKGEIAICEEMIQRHVDEYLAWLQNQPPRVP